MNRIRPLLSTLLALLLGAAFAQAEVSGSVAGTIDGETATWNTYADVLRGDLYNTASWIEPMAGMAIRSYTILAQTDVALFSVTEGAIMISVETFGEIGPCPCTFAEAEILYFTGKTFSSDFYTTSDATVTFDELEEIDVDTLRVRGSFAGELAFKADFMSQEDPDDTVTIEGTFELERMTREPEGE